MPPADEKLIYHRAQVTRFAGRENSLEYEVKVFEAPARGLVTLQQTWYDFLGSGGPCARDEIILTTDELAGVLGAVLRREPRPT